MSQIPVGFLEATFVFALSGSTHDMTWTMGFDDSNFATTTAAEEAEALYGFYVNVSAPVSAANMCDSYTFRGVSVRRQQELGTEVGQWMIPVVGTSSSPALPPNCTQLWHKVTTQGGRRGRGRAFVPIYSPAEGGVDATGVIEGTTVTNLQAKYDVFLAAAAAAGMLPVLFHQTAPFTPSPIVAFQLQSMIATQRRRLRR